MNEDTVIVAIVFGSILGMIVFPMLISLAKKWIDRNNASYDEDKFDRLAKAFIQHKKDTDRRLQNIEAIITDDEPKTRSATSSSSGKKELNEKQKRPPIKIESNQPQEKETESGDGNLRNMLKE